MSAQRKYWPFAVGDESKILGEKREQITFLKEAFDEGFCPYVEGETFGLRSGDRGAILLARGRCRWEVVLGVVEMQNVSAFVRSFHTASAAALRWVRGDELDDVAECLTKDLADVPRNMRAITVTHPVPHDS